MVILVLFGGSYPSGSAMTKRLHLYCKGLIEEGESVKIIVPHESEHFGKLKNKNKEGIHDNVPFKYLSNSTERSKNFFKRRIDDIIGYFRLCFYLIKNREKADIYFLVDIRNLFKYVILIISYFTKTKVVYEINEHPIVLTGKLNFWFDKNFFYSMLDGFIVISKPLEKLISAFKKEKANIVIVPILTEKTERLTIGSLNHLIDEPYIFHSGSLTEAKDGILGMVKAFSIVVNVYRKNIKFYLTGTISSSPNFHQLRELIESNKLNERIVFLGYLSDQDLKFYQKNCLLSIINKKDNLQNNFCFPTKLGEYLSFGRPVIMTNVGALKDYFIDNENAIVVKENDLDLIAEKIVKVLNEPEQSAAIGLRGKELSDNLFNYKNQAKKIVEFFNNLNTSKF